MMTSNTEQKNENEHSHCKNNWLFARRWENIASLLCSQLIAIMKYCNACKNKEISIIKNSTLHDYIMTRLENIERCYSSLYLGGKLTNEEFGYYEGIQDLMINTLEGTIPNQYKDSDIGVWGSFKLFDWYIQSFLNSDFFKKNDIRIE